MAFAMAPTDGRLPALWSLGIAAGFALQRSRFCFASAFRDLFLFGSARIMKAILLGLGVASAGFAVIMRGAVPFAENGALPPEAHILPVGVTTIIGGLLFGYGMVLSGGCVSGSLYRAAEGYVGSWVALAGAVVGLGLLSQTWNWWWAVAVSAEPTIWLPGVPGLGYAGAIALTLAALVGAYVFFVWWEARAGLGSAETAQPRAVAHTFRDQLTVTWRAVFVRGWPALVGGAALGGIATLMYVVHMPWGVTGELMRWANASMTALGAPPPEALGLADIGGCAARADETGIFTHTFAVTVGLLPGAAIGALLAKEFKLRFPRSARRYLQSLVGGLFMGYGSGLAIGCTIGAFFSSIASLGLSGWLFGLALAGGAYLGVRTIQRIP
ncbi:MAG: YeeE/YedE family protein [Chloroflexi bacterium]|nr:YeeE/YedE family protein [Chloroflexota bacterium]